MATIESVLKIVDHENTILSTGKDPDSLQDLLVIGEKPRDVYFISLMGKLVAMGLGVCVSDDALVVKDKESIIGMAYYERPLFAKKLEDIYTGNSPDPVIKPWSIGPWLPEAFASDLKRSRSVVADNHEAQRIHSMFRVYPLGLQGAIIRYCRQEIKTKKLLLNNERTINNALATDILINDLCLSSIRLIYATEQIYFRGLKALEESLPELSRDNQDFINTMILAKAQNELGALVAEITRQTSLV